MELELIVFLGYMFFLFGLMLAANNLQRNTLKASTEEAIQEVLYNLRKLPRVNYKEESSDEEEEQEDTQQESESEVEEGEVREETPVLSTSSVKRRRDNNPLSSLLQEVD